MRLVMSAGGRQQKIRGVVGWCLFSFFFFFFLKFKCKCTKGGKVFDQAEAAFRLREDDFLEDVRPLHGGEISLHLRFWKHPMFCFKRNLVDFQLVGVKRTHFESIVELIKKEEQIPNPIEAEYKAIHKYDNLKKRRSGKRLCDMRQNEMEGDKLFERILLQQNSVLTSFSVLTGYYLIPIHEQKKESGKCNCESKSAANQRMYTSDTSCEIKPKICYPWNYVAPKTFLEKISVNLQTKSLKYENDDKPKQRGTGLLEKFVKIGIRCPVFFLDPIEMLGFVNTLQKFLIQGWWHVTCVSRESL